jgi:hypothetical protein
MGLLLAESVGKRGVRSKIVLTESSKRRLGGSSLQPCGVLVDLGVLPPY